MATATGVDFTLPPFDQFKAVKRLAKDRSGQPSGGHPRHLLYTGRDQRRHGGVLIKLTAAPGVVYEANLNNEIASLSTINRELADSPHFPVIRDHGRLPDGRVYLITTLFEEFPLATAIGDERLPGKLVSYLQTTLAVAAALSELHKLRIYHVDLNPMNILSRIEKGRPIIRIVDFESSYDCARHAKGAFYNPPTTQGYSAPEIPRQAPDGRADLFSLGAVLYTMLAGYGWSSNAEVASCVHDDAEIDIDLKNILLKALALNPDHRYPSVDQFSGALGRYLEIIWPGRRA